MWVYMHVIIYLVEVKWLTALLTEEETSWLNVIYYLEVPVLA